MSADSQALRPCAAWAESNSRASACARRWLGVITVTPPARPRAKRVKSCSLESVALVSGDMVAYDNPRALERAAFARLVYDRHGQSRSPATRPRPVRAEHRLSHPVPQPHHRAGVDPGLLSHPLCVERRRLLARDLQAMGEDIDRKSTRLN